MNAHSHRTGIRIAAFVTLCVALLVQIFLPNVEAQTTVENTVPSIAASSAPDTTCKLYPIGLNAKSLDGAEPGDVIEDVYNGERPGNFGWLSWAGKPSERALAISLTPPGDSYSYVNPMNPTDGVISLGDWVSGSPGISNSKAVREAMGSLKDNDITVPVWDEAEGSGNNAKYRVSAFARVRLLDYRLSKQNSISARFLGYSGCGSKPTVEDVSLTTNEDTPVAITLKATDRDSSDLTFTLGAASHGSIGPLSAPDCRTASGVTTCTTTTTYKPDADYNGSDAFTYKVSEGNLDSNAATVSITIAPINDAPTVEDIVLSDVQQGVPKTVTLSGQDIDSGSLSFSIVSGPDHGSLSAIGEPMCSPAGEGVNCSATATYTASLGYKGVDSFTFKASDGIENSKAATVSITVVGPSQTLVLSPTKLRVRDVGAKTNLRVFIEEGGTRTEVSDDPGTTYHSSAPSVVAVNSSGVMTFLSEGSARITAEYNGMSATAEIEIDSTAKLMIEAPVGPAGGSVMLPNGTGVSIPPEALTSTQIIHIEEITADPASFQPEDGAPVDSAYDFSPNGLTFSKPVSISMSYDPDDVPSGDDAKSLLISRQQTDGGWTIDGLTPVEDGSESVNQGVDLTRHIVETDTEHFSVRQITISGVTLTPTTLTAPDGTELRVIQYIKQQRTCSGITKAVDNRPAGTDISYIIIHSTGSYRSTTQFSGEVRYAHSSDSCNWAHYYIDKDGTIIQVSHDSQKAFHIGSGGPDPDNPTMQIDNSNAIGIELFMNCGPGSTATTCVAPSEDYPGTQISALIRLIDFLLREHSTITRPGPYSPLPAPPALNRGNIRVHAEVPVGHHFDPAGNFRICPPKDTVCTTPKGVTSLEEIVYHALREDHKGLIDARGGDGLGASDGGKGGNVVMEFGEPTLENPVDDTRPSLIVPAGTTVNFTGNTNLMHLIVDGTLVFNADTTLDVDGTFYVSPTGRLVAKGNPLHPDGYSLNITADGIALIDGEIDTSGSNATLSDGKGGDAGTFSFRTAAPGPAWIPTIIMRGGDADSITNNFDLKKGGDGGSVEIQAVRNNADDRAYVYFQGSDKFAASCETTPGIGEICPDTLPPPPPYNQMPVIVANPLDPPFEFQCKRPTANERLPLGRDSSGANISRFERGILTVGGMGGASDVIRDGVGGPGGNGGRIEIRNLTDGRLIFKDVDLFTGAGMEDLCYKIFISSFGDFSTYGAPSGGLGGMGSLNGGDGGRGGNAGDIFVEGNIHPTAQPPVPTSILGHDGENPNYEFSRLIGQSYRVVGSDGKTLFETDSTGGSGGSPGGGSSGFPGWFGAKGNDGMTIVNGVQYYP